MQRFFNVNVNELITIIERVTIESFRFSPSPGGSQPKGTVTKQNLEATAGEGSFTPPVAYKTQDSGRDMPGSKRYSL